MFDLVDKIRWFFETHIVHLDSVVRFCQQPRFFYKVRRHVEQVSFVSERLSEKLCYQISVHDSERISHH